MSSKTADKKGRASWFGSLAARMTFWYALSAFALVLTASGFLYRALTDSLAHEDDVLLSENIHNLNQLIVSSQGDLEDIQEFVGETPKWYRMISFWTRLLDDQGRVMTETPGMSRSLPPNLFKAGLSKERNLTVLATDGKIFRVQSSQDPWPGKGVSYVTVQMAMDMSSDETILQKFKSEILVIQCFSLLACALVGYWIAQRGIQPVKKMAETAARIRSSTLYERLERAGLPLELSDLAATFNGMLDRLEESFGRLSRFSSDIAHELRTPLQNLRGEAEVVLTKARTGLEYQDHLGSALEEYQRLASLIDSLLFLARAENPQTQIKREELDMRKELVILHDYYGPSAGESNIAVRVEAAEGLRVRVDRSLFQRAVGNLVENSMIYTPPGGSLVLKASAGEGVILVEVSDTGKGIPEDQVSKVFDRFYRVDPSRSPSSGGSGLGLSIVKSIMDMHGGTVEIQSQVGQGTRVILSFPDVS